MTEHEYHAAIPIGCTFPHITMTPRGDVCWGMTNGLVQKSHEAYNYCSGCEFYPVSARRRRHIEAEMHRAVDNAVAVR